jgi:DNA-binding FadR family transcriptional regulator
MSVDKSPSAIEHALTVDILRGRHAIGSRLPTVRELAELHGVNPTTIQRVVSRLETRGLVTARQGSGLRVNDPSETGDISLMPYWLEATLDDPARARGILDDLLELRRVVAVRLLLRHREAVLGRVERLREAAGEMAAAQGAGVDALRDADLAFSRELLRATNNVVALSVFNTVARVLIDVPHVAAAMYAEPEQNVASMLRVVQALVAHDPQDANSERIMDETMTAVDARTLARFEALLRSHAESHDDARKETPR